MGFRKQPIGRLRLKVAKGEVVTANTQLSMACCAASKQHVPPPPFMFIVLFEEEEGHVVYKYTNETLDEQNKELKNNIYRVRCDTT